LYSSAHHADAAAIQSELDKFLEAATQNGPEDGGPFDASTATAYAVFKSARSIHMAMVPAKIAYDWDGPGGKEPEFRDRVPPVFIVEVDSMDAVDAYLKKLGDKVQTKEVKGLKVHLLKESTYRVQPQALAKLDDHTLVVTDADTAMERILEMKAAGPGGSLGQKAEFREAYQKFGDKGDLFAYASFDAIRTKEPDVPKMLSWLAGYADIGGELTVQIKAGGGTEFPEFLIGRAKPKQFLSRIPAEAVLVTDGTCNGGKQTREALVAWLKKELEAPDGLGKMFPGEVRDQAQQMLESANNLEQEMVVRNPTMLLAAIPLKSEFATYVAPDRGGKWGMAAFCDVEERAKADLLVAKLKEFEKTSPVPLTWETKSIGGTTINYVDFAKLMPPGAVPDEVKRSVDFQVGYALNNDLLAVGTVGAIEFVLQPSGATYADRIQWKGVDRENMMVLSLAPGSVVHHKFGVPPVDDVLARIAKEIPRDANYTFTLNIEKQDATLRTNIPLSSLIGWLSVEFNTENGPAKLKELVGGREPKGPRILIEEQRTRVEGHAHDDAKTEPASRPDPASKSEPASNPFPK